MNYDYDDFKQLEFKVKNIHLTLLDNTYLEWLDDSYDGYVAMNAKRPYGNSNRINDIIQLMKLDKEFEYLNFSDDEDMEPTDIQENVANDIHRQMIIIFKILIDTKSIKPGIYKRDSYNSWENSKWYFKDSNDTISDIQDPEDWEFESKTIPTNISINKNEYDLEIVGNSIKITIKD